jgi:hypothetical protein
MPEDTPQGEEQRTMLTFAEAAERLVEDKIAQSMTAEGLRRLARDPLSGWPIGPSDYRMAGKVRMLPYELLAPYMRERLGKRRGRGPDTKKRSPKPKQQGDPMSTTVDPRIAILSDLSDPPYNEVTETRCVPWDDAVKLLDAYRAAVVTEIVEALTTKGTELSELAEEEMRPSLEERAQTWYEAAGVAEKLKRATE